MVKIGIVGGVEYADAALPRLPAIHPQADVGPITSRGDRGLQVADRFPSLQGRDGLGFDDLSRGNPAAREVVFPLVPSGVLMQQAPALLDAGVWVIKRALAQVIPNMALVSGLDETPCLCQLLPSLSD